jgi:hypothetical protein
MSSALMRETFTDRYRRSRRGYVVHDATRIVALITKLPRDVILLVEDWLQYITAANRIQAAWRASRERLNRMGRRRTFWWTPRDDNILFEDPRWVRGFDLT